MVYYHIAVDRVVLERSLDTRLSVYTVYSVESKHTGREGGGRGNTTLLDIEDRDAQWRVVFAHRG